MIPGWLSSSCSPGPKSWTSSSSIASACASISKAAHPRISFGDIACLCTLNRKTLVRLGNRLNELGLPELRRRVTQLLLSTADAPSVACSSAKLLPAGPTAKRMTGPRRRLTTKATVSSDGLIFIGTVTPPVLHPTTRQAGQVSAEIPSPSPSPFRRLPRLPKHAGAPPPATAASSDA